MKKRKKKEEIEQEEEEKREIKRVWRMKRAEQHVNQKSGRKLRFVLGRGSGHID